MIQLRRFSRFLPVVPLFRAVAAFVLAGGAVSCTAVHQDTKSDAFRRDYGRYAYAEVRAVRQSTEKSCGLACLACVLIYWDKPVSEADLVARHPVPDGHIGLSLGELQQAALKEGLTAFAVSIPQTGKSPAAALTEEISKGRPIIVAVHCPAGKYFGDPLPVIESADFRSLKPLGVNAARRNHHYVVVCGEDPKHYLVMDPALGIGPVQKQSLLDWWKDEQWAALIASPVAP